MIPCIWNQHELTDGVYHDGLKVIVRYPKAYELFGWLAENGFDMNFLNEANRINTKLSLGGELAPEEAKEFLRFSELYNSPSYWIHCTTLSDKDMLTQVLEDFPRKESEKLEKMLKDFASLDIDMSFGMEWAVSMIEMGVPWVPLHEMTAQQSIVFLKLAEARIEKVKERMEDAGQ